jgi:hypothetical protein
VEERQVGIDAGGGAEALEEFEEGRYVCGHGPRIDPKRPFDKNHFW